MLKVLPTVRSPRLVRAHASREVYLRVQDLAALLLEDFHLHLSKILIKEFLRFVLTLLITSRYLHWGLLEVGDVLVLGEHLLSHWRRHVHRVLLRGLRYSFVDRMVLNVLVHIFSEEESLLLLIGRLGAILLGGLVHSCISV